MDFTARAGSGLPSSVSGAGESTSADDAAKQAAASCPTSSSHEQPSKLEITYYDTASSSPTEPVHQVDDWCSTSRVGKTSTPPTIGVEESTTVGGAQNKKKEELMCGPTAQLLRELSVKLADTKDVEATQPVQQVDDWCSTSRVEKASTPPTNGFEESTTVGTVGSAEKEKPTCGPTTQLLQQLDIEVTDSKDAEAALVSSPDFSTPDGSASTTVGGAENKKEELSCGPTTQLLRQLRIEVADSKDIGAAHVLPHSSSPNESPSTKDGRESALVSSWTSYSRQKLVNKDEVTEIPDPGSSDVSPKSFTPADQSLPTDECHRPACKLLPPPTKPKPALPRPAPSAARVADPLPQPSLIQDDSTSSPSTGRGRTTPDGGSDSDSRESPTTTTPSFQTSPTSSAGREDAEITAAFSFDACSAPGDQSFQKDQATVHSEIVVEKLTNERQQSDGTRGG